MASDAPGFRGHFYRPGYFTLPLFKFAFLFGLILATPVDALAAQYAELALSSTWKKLLHYESDLASPSGLKSAIHSPEFFLADDGPTNPAAELQASLTEMLRPLADHPDRHAKCRFPARLIWLRQHLPEHAAALAEIQCPAYAAWSGIKRVDSISVVFANGYLGNPASYYGHLFLKFNQTRAAGKSRLLDVTVNYGAILDQQDDPLTYIFKGILGGYDGGFSPADFYFHDATYGESELRDLWEYPLNLPKAALELIIAHAWEVDHKKYTYYFFHHNCAYRVAELLEIVEGIEVIPKRPWLLPQAVLQQISSASYQGQPLLAGKSYHPSRQSRLYAKHVALNASEQRVVEAIVHGASALDAPELRQLAPERRAAVIDTVLDYQQFAFDRSKQQAGARSSPEYFKALAARLALPPGEPPVVIGEVESPEQGRAPSWLQAGHAQHSRTGATKTLRFRPAYYDALDASRTQAWNGSLAMGDVLLEESARYWRIRQADLLAIDSTNPAVTGLPGDRGLAWKLRFGAEPERYTCSQCRVTRLQGDVGLGRRLGASDIFAALYAGGAVQTTGRFDGLGFARLSAAITFRPTPDFGVRLSHEQRRPFEADRQVSSATRAEFRLGIRQEYDLRLAWERDDEASRLTVGLGFYL